MLELFSKHQDKPDVVKLRGKWVEVDPREWRNRFNMTVTVGLGTGNKSTELQGAMGILQVQGGLAQAGFGRLVSEKNAYEAAIKFAKATFPRDAKAMFTDPSTLPPPQPQPNPDMIKLELQKHKMELQDAQKKAQMTQKEQMDANNKRFEAYMADVQARLDQAEQQQKLQLEREKAEREERMAVIQTISQSRTARDDNAAAESQIVLKGAIDGMLEKQSHLHSQMEQVLKSHTEMISKSKPESKPA